mgnify:CR=1 FL=1
METTRERIARLLRDRPMTPSELAAAVDTTTETAVDHVVHIARSLAEQDATLLVSPPTCQECGFDGFDDPANLPSRCPKCRHEGIDEPTFTIR